MATPMRTYALMPTCTMACVRPTVYQVVADIRLRMQVHACYSRSVLDNVFGHSQVEEAALATRTVVVWTRLQRRTAKVAQPPFHQVYNPDGIPGSLGGLVPRLPSGFHRSHLSGWRILITPSMHVWSQMLADSAGATCYYSLMAGYGERALAAYGVTDALTGTGGSFSLALWTAISIRVGTLLGENDPARARKASVVGMWYSVLLGVILSCILFVLRKQLAEFLSPTDVAVQGMMLDVIAPVCLFYLLSSVQYGLWGILQGQSRVCMVSVAITANTWAFAVPFTYASLRMWGPDSDAFAALHNTTALLSGGSGCDSDEELLPLRLMWWSITAAMVLCNALMSGAILRSDWQKLADEAVEYATFILFCRCRPLQL